VAAVALATAGPLAARTALAARGARRREAVAWGAPAVARAIADALGGGHSIRGALIAAARVVDGAAGDELRRAAVALEFGEPLETVLARMRARVRAPAWDTLTAAVLLHAQAGGDLAGLLRDLAARLEQARRDGADARAATAQARFTAWMVAGLPAVAAVLAELAAPGFLAGLVSEPLAAALVGASAVLQLAAVAAIRRIVHGAREP
jgi:tight adherence protein B